MIQHLFRCAAFCGVLPAALASSDKAMFYNAPEQFTQTKSVLDFGAIPNDEQDDSEAFQLAINALTHDNEAAVLDIPEGQFQISDVILKSNVHLRLTEKSTLIPSRRPNQKNYTLIHIGNNEFEATNVSISARNGRFTVDLTPANNPNVTVFRVTRANNFRLANFHVIDKQTKFSAIAFGLAYDAAHVHFPSHGLVENASIEQAHYGYGLVQAQAVKKTEFRNLAGQGGITLRLETGLNSNNLERVGGVFDVIGKNISCEQGNSAAMLSPHTLVNGYVSLNGIHANACGFAVRVSRGFANKEQRKLKLPPGRFSDNSSIQNVTAIFGKNAQLKKKHFKYLSCEQRAEVRPDKHSDEETYIGPSIATLANFALGNEAGHYPTNIDNDTISSFPLAFNSQTLFSFQTLISEANVIDCEDK